MRLDLVRAVMAAAFCDFRHIGPPPVIEVEGKNVLVLGEAPDPLRVIKPPETSFEEAARELASGAPTCTETIFDVKPQQPYCGGVATQRQSGSFRPSNLNKAARRMANIAKAMKVNPPSGKRTARSGGPYLP